MSKFIDEIVYSIRENSSEWCDNDGCGVKKGNIEVSLYGNSAMLSIINVWINGKTVPTTWLDRFKLEKAISFWYRNVPLSTISR